MSRFGVTGMAESALARVQVQRRESISPRNRPITNTPPERPRLAIAINAMSVSEEVELL